MIAILSGRVPVLEEMPEMMNAGDEANDENRL